jgi:Acetyl-coenzyme A synthetase N-terminus
MSALTVPPPVPKPDSKNSSPGHGPDSCSMPKPENISNLLALDEEYPAPHIVARNTLQQDWLGECARARQDPGGFWGTYADRFNWSRKWDQVLEWDGVHHKWFTGGKTNITVNALLLSSVLGELER